MKKEGKRGKKDIKENQIPIFLLKKVNSDNRIENINIIYLLKEKQNKRQT